MRYERAGGAALLLAGAMALALPGPAAAQAPILVGLCNGGLVPLPAGQDGKGKNEGKNCRVACHTEDSRKRLPGLPPV